MHHQRQKRNGDPLRTFNNPKGSGWIDEFGYRRIQIGEKTYREHRLNWERAHGPIPPGYDVHHINHVRDDNRLENLELIKKSRHLSHHKKGTKHTLETREKMRQSALQRPAMKRRRGYCSICPADHFGKGLCRKHYEAQRYLSKKQ